MRNCGMRRPVLRYFVSDPPISILADFRRQSVRSVCSIFTVFSVDAYAVCEVEIKSVRKNRAVGYGQIALLQYAE